MPIDVAVPKLSIPPEIIPTAYLSLLIDIDAHVAVNQIALCEILTILRGQIGNPNSAMDNYQQWSREFAEELKVAVLAKWGE